MRVIANSTAMREVARRLERAARADCPVVIWGEEGSGKRFVAEQIHRHSRRSSAPLIAVRSPQPSMVDDGRDCLLEDERLFGTPEQPGKVAEAAGGTMLVDEITSFSLTLQAKMLGAAEGHGVYVDNDASAEPVDFRLVATTRRDPAASVRRGELRQDLHYRIGVIAIRMPALRERREDIPDLIRELTTELCARRRTDSPPIESGLVRYALEYAWPGNVTELRECLEAMVRTGGGHPLSVQRLRAAIAENEGSMPGVPPSQHVATLDRLEREAVLHALGVCQGNRTLAAKSLGISVRTLQRKLRRWQA